MPLEAKIVVRQGAHTECNHTGRCAASRGQAPSYNMAVLATTNDGVDAG